MRKKPYYTKDEIINNLYTFGKEYMIKDGTDYKGLYHKYTTGEIYTKATWDPETSVLLVKQLKEDPTKILYKKLKPDLKTSYPGSIVNYIPRITSKDRNKGFIQRYFIQNISTREIREIDKKQYTLYKTTKLDPNLYVVAIVKWIITGPLQDSFTGTVLNLSVQKQNSEQAILANKKIKGIFDILSKNLVAFYSDIDYTVPADINER